MYIMINEALMIKLKINYCYRKALNKKLIFSKACNYSYKVLCKWYKIKNKAKNYGIQNLKRFNPPLKNFRFK